MLFFVYGQSDRTDLIAELAACGMSFTDTLSSKDAMPCKVGVACLSFDGEHLQYLATVRKTRKVATATWGVRFENVVEIPSVRLASVKAGLEPKLRRHFIPHEHFGLPLPDVTEKAVLAYLQSQFPEVSAEIGRLTKLCRLERKQVDSASNLIRAEEKDALLLATSIFGLKDRGKILDSMEIDLTDDSAPFLRGLAASALREDTMINNDSRTFPGWEAWKQYQLDAIQFKNDKDERLTVMNVNRRPLESTLGVDLIYYHHQYESFVMVQYKRMTSKGEGRSVYRPTDTSYQSELENMKRVHEILERIEYPPSVSGYRLSSTGFYFKLCPAVTYAPLTPDLIKGMYIPLPYWELLVGSGLATGPEGGLAISYENVGRYLSNTTWCQLVQDGWIGTRLAGSEILNDLINASLAGDRSLMLAISEKLHLEGATS